MNKKIVTLILVILISFCFLSIVVADNAKHGDYDTSDHGKINKDKKIDKNKTDDKNKTSDKNKSDDKSKKNYILAKGKGNDIKFSDGYRGFRLDYSKPAASPGDEFKSVSASKASNSNKLKHAVVQCYRQDCVNEIGSVMASVIKSGSHSKVSESGSDSQKQSDNGVIKINNETEAVFSFEVLKSVSGNESDYFAYTVSFKSVGAAGGDMNETNNLTNTTNNTDVVNNTYVNQQMDNNTNSTFLKNFYDQLASLADALYGAWKPIVDTLINNFLMAVAAIEGLANLFGGIMMEFQSLMDALGELLKMLQSMWNQLEGILKLFTILLAVIEQILNLIGAIINFIIGLISAIIALIQQILALLFALLQFLLDLINQILLLIQAILDFLKSVGSFLMNVISNALIIITAFVIITIGAFVYNRIR